VAYNFVADITGIFIYLDIIALPKSREIQIKFATVFDILMLKARKWLNFPTRPCLRPRSGTP